MNNFDDPYQPKAVQLPAGQGRQLQQDVKSMIEHIRREIPKAFESKEYGSRRDEIGEALDRQRSQVLECMGERAGFVASKSLRPQPVPLDVKVIVVGRPLLYYLLYGYDEEFPELFKVKADFDIRMARNEDNLRGRQGRAARRAAGGGSRKALDAFRGPGRCGA